MSIPITDKFKPKGAGGYALMDAEDIQMPDGKRLSEWEPGGGVSSWNDLTDKPFYEEGGEVEIFPEQELTFTGSSGIYTLESSPALFVLAEGETYRVVVDGTEHELVCALDDYGARGFSHYVLDESGEPTDGTFVIMYGSAEVTGTEGGATVVSVFDSSNTATHTLGIYQNGTTIKTLDAKFLPMDAIDARIEAYISAALEGDY